MPADDAASDTPAAPADAEQFRQKRRFRNCVTAFLILAAVVVGVPVTIGLVAVLRHRAEERIVKQLRAYRDAQYAYHREDRDGDKRTEYARTAKDLLILKDLPAEIAKLVDEGFAAARGANGQPRDGYLYLEMKTVFGVPINWEGEFAICATPAVYGKTGRKTYILKTDGDVWAQDLGKSEFVEDFPMDVSGKGWEKWGVVPVPKE
jgi:hypothetical protein